MRLAWATKGFEAHSGLLPHQVARATLGTGRAYAVLSGPTFASEVGAGLPTAMTVASPDEHFAAALAQDLSSANFRAYTSTDIVGVEVGGAVKNVLALAAGLLRRPGVRRQHAHRAHHSRADRDGAPGVALGAKRETFMGLAGLGDLVLSCTDDQSRNRRFGLLLAQGRTSTRPAPRSARWSRGCTRRVPCAPLRSASRCDMPLCEGVYRVLVRGLPAERWCAPDVRTDAGRGGLTHRDLQGQSWVAAAFFRRLLTA